MGNCANRQPRYDALTIDNRVRYQNGITDANKPFFDVSDGIFTNYWWREQGIRRTADIAAALGRPRDVFSGVDVWGRGTLGGGGFNIGEVRSPCWKDTCIMLKTFIHRPWPRSSAMGLLQQSLLLVGLLST